VWRENEWSCERLGVYKISHKQFYENAPNKINNSNLGCYVQPVAIPLKLNPRAKTTLFDPTVVNDLVYFASDWR
jgi:hypothetical protein